MVIAMQNKEPINREPRKYAESDDKEFISDRFPTMKTLKSENNEAHAEEKAGEEKSSEAVSDQSGFFTPNEKIDFTGVKIEPLFADQVDFDTFSKSDFRAVKVKACEAVPKSKKLLKFVLDDGTGTDRVILSGIHAYY